MNFLNYLTGLPAVLVALTAALMWGTWFISLKHIKEYPVEAFYVVMFSFALVFVWGVSLLLEGAAVFENIVLIWQRSASKLIITLIGGMLYSSGIWVALKVMGKVGLALSQPLLQSISLIAGVVVTVLLGGRPETLTNTKILLTMVFLLSAVAFVYFADMRRMDEQAQRDEKKPTSLKAVVGLIALSAVLTVSYDVAMAYGLETITQPDGLKVLPFMCLLCTGAFLGVLLTCGSVLTRRRQWRCIWRTPMSIHKWSVFSGFCHYGGNIIHSFATRGLSAAISFPLGLTCGLWTQLWGLMYGEFRGARTSAYVFLFLSFACYVAGAYCISM